MKSGSWEAFISEEDENVWSLWLSYDSNEVIIVDDFKSEKEAVKYSKRQLEKMGKQLIALSKKIK